MWYVNIFCNMCSVDIIREYIYIYTWGALSARKKKVIFNKTYFLKIRDGKGLKI